MSGKVFASLWAAGSTLSRHHTCNTFSAAESAMWGQVPQVYQVYRVWQLIRGCSLVQQMGGAGWLWTLQAMLIMLWVFNFGVVCTWTPWLYRWHLQPSQAAYLQQG